MNKHIEEARGLYDLSKTQTDADFANSRSLQSIASSLIAIAMMMEEQQSNKKDE